MNENILENDIKERPMELDIDAVGLWQIIRIPKKLKLSENEFKKHIYNVIISLMENGAVPVISTENEGYEWEEINTFGKTFEEIANNISNKWYNNMNINNTIFDMGGVWFARPVVGKKYVKILNKSIN